MPQDSQRQFQSFLLAAALATACLLLVEPNVGSWVEENYSAVTLTKTNNNDTQFSHDPASFHERAEEESRSQKWKIGKHEETDQNHKREMEMKRARPASIADYTSEDHVQKAVKRAKLLLQNISSDERKRDPLVAVCMIGNARTMSIGSVYRRLQKNLVEALSENTFVFAHLKTWDTDVKKQDQFGNFPPIPVNSSSLLKAIRAINPVYLKLETSRPKDESFMNPHCQFTEENAKALRQPLLFANPENTPRFVGQMHTLNQCYESVMSFERSANVTFDAVVKARPDTVYFFRSFPAQELILRDLVTHFSDIFIFAARRYSDGFTRWWKNYTSCSGLWNGPYSPEIAFSLGFQEMGAFYYYDRKTPISIRRASKSETSAIW
eukprot:CAMPEP_0114502962 /NCGR_PEP_ID=MMETSP0109-20121206/9387_1 /TAXON_ID=29199 /ORGANISM="Chlorarachnion reptans, Strain CCCM449" /LENGTH=379 /DNA_ID=CAMNT_0001680945 /DNA_START=195 /DNA_END=1331 /DNA_ORIENTATION=-